MPNTVWDDLCLEEYVDMEGVTLHYLLSRLSIGASRTPGAVAGINQQPFLPPTKLLGSEALRTA